MNVRFGSKAVVADNPLSAKSGHPYWSCYEQSRLPVEGALNARRRFLHEACDGTHRGCAGRRFGDERAPDRRYARSSIRRRQPDPGHRRSRAARLLANAHGTPLRGSVSGTSVDTVGYAPQGVSAFRIVRGTIAVVGDDDVRLVRPQILMRA